MECYKATEELCDKLDSLVLAGFKCLVVSDSQYSLLQQRVSDREQMLGVLRDGKVRYMVYHGVHVYPDSQVANIS